MANIEKEENFDRKTWNSLEICKLLATVITPLTVFALGCLIWSGQRDMVQHWERDQLEERRLIDADTKERERIREFRLSIYKEAAPLLNEILAYHFYVGRWKERSPADIIEKKRQLDSLMYSNIAIFTPTFFDLYRTFMRQSFRAAGNHYGESRIRTQAQCRQPRQTDDAGRWLTHFTHEDTRRLLCLAYVNLLGRLSEELLLQSLKMPSQTEAEKLSICPPIYEAERC
jgi:hypothetical protein